MGMVHLKPLTAYVVENIEQDCAFITLKNDQGAIVKELRHAALSTKLDKTLAINDHLKQMITAGLNITKLESDMPGINLP
jgi:hypothetical protein